MEVMVQCPLTELTLLHLLTGDILLHLHTEGILPHLPTGGTLLHLPMEGTHPYTMLLKPMGCPTEEDMLVMQIQATTQDYMDLEVRFSLSRGEICVK